MGPKVCVFFKQKTAHDMRISDWSSDVCSSDRKLGAGRSVEDGYRAARRTAVCLLAALKAEVGDLNKVHRIVRVFGMVNATPEFSQHPQVINGASDLLVAVFGERGRHARAAVGMRSEEHTSELQSLMRISYAVFCLKKKK